MYNVSIDFTQNDQTIYQHLPIHSFKTIQFAYLKDDNYYYNVCIPIPPPYVGVFGLC